MKYYLHKGKSQWSKLKATDWKILKMVVLDKFYLEMTFELIKKMTFAYGKIQKLTMVWGDNSDLKGVQK